MDIMGIIEEYINLTRKRVAIKKGRGQYVVSAPFLRQLPHLDTVDIANIDEQDELAVVIAKMDETYKQYEAALASLDANTLKGIYLQISSKAAELKEKSERLTDHKNWANREEETAFHAQDSVAEKRYENIYTSCSQSLGEIKQVLPYYRYFESDMMIRISRMAENKSRKSL